MPIIPRKLEKGDTIRVVAPSCALGSISPTHQGVIDARFAAMGLRYTFGAHIDECDEFDSASVESRVADIHAAFADREVAGILTVIGGYNANQLLPYLDWQLIRQNPKIFCGYSDITALQAAMLAKADLVTYSGPHWLAFGMRELFEETQEAFLDCLFSGAALELRPSARWTDDTWFLDQDDRQPQPNDGWWVLHHGEASGQIVGGNLCTLNLLQGTEFMPSLDGSVLMIEDDYESQPPTFDRDLTSLLQQRDARGIRGVVIGRFQTRSDMPRDRLRAIIDSKRELAGLPVIANVDFGHTNPMLTIPIGGSVRMEAGAGNSRIAVTEH
ncbi:MAG TPA: S66 peptidase family protein [Mycobacteriales bacterium]|nr:S66 peptidase family protein [Mycobacteriales bacterium]